MFGIARTAVARLAQVRQPLKDLLRQSTRSYGEFAVNIPLAAATVDTNMGIPLVGNKILATYIWVDGTGENLREKTRTLENDPGAPENYPRWSFDGSSTYQALKGEDSDMILKVGPIQHICEPSTNEKNIRLPLELLNILRTPLEPAAVYPDPFFGGNHKLVLCKVLDPHEKPAKTNHRAKCKEVMDKIDHTNPWFGMEQEYLFLDRDGHPLGWPKFGFPKPQGPYYCAVGGDRIFGREIVNTHYRASIYAGLAIFGINSEVTPGQWEYQLGQCRGIEMGDQMWMSRYLLHRVAEQFGVTVTFHPKPAITRGNWNGAGCHCNFSTEEMRGEGGIAAIEAAMPKLEATHKECIRVYDPHDGEDNKHRLTGKHETSSYDHFSWGVANRAASVRLPRGVAQAKKGYLEDRRPSSNCDPYQVTRMIAESILLR
ncbi:hypothetical protein Y032_0221g2544 [Ancylostoma ceylanicum]|uniref:glutamine synthetase n=1 Tax=Ancylostoma ceylanicum TaxID=53326 RepID=A0A016SJ10_9BILA|nr:hypothetical protein Y032_0221g2544 [Ancylostoma ceylanicum]